MEDISATIAYLEHIGSSSADTQVQVLASPQHPLSPDTVVNASANETATGPEKPFLMYDGIKVIGDEEFQKNVVMTLEFAKKYSPPDYQFIKENNKWIKSTDMLKTAGAGIDGINWGREHLNGGLKVYKNIRGAVMTAAHESGHNLAYRTNRSNFDNETYADSFAKSAQKNLSYVNESEMEKFYAEFDFSKFKK
ncbi:Uncharacterised protein [uncultured archaeon]|nr:Uncharacterised protein [uncultured archaeon]